MKPRNRRRIEMRDRRWASIVLRVLNEELPEVLEKKIPIRSNHECRNILD